MVTDKNGGANYLRAWREKRHMTQEDLAAALSPPTTGAVISLLEEGKRGLSAKWLRKIAPVFGISPGHLLDHHPDELPDEVIDIWTHIDEREKPRALRVLDSFRTGTHD